MASLLYLLLFISVLNEFARSPLGTLSSRAILGVVWVAQQISRVVNYLIDFLLNAKGTGRRISRRATILWVLMNFLPLIIYAIAAHLNNVPVTIDFGYGFFIGAGFQVLVLTTSLFIMLEDDDAMNGLVAQKKRKFAGDRVASRWSVIYFATAMFFIYSVAIFYWASEVAKIDLYVTRPDTGWFGIDYVLIALWSLPSDFLMPFTDWVSGENTKPVFQNTWSAWICYNVIHGVGTYLVINLIVIAAQQTMQLRRIVGELGEARGEELRFLVERARRAPPIIRRGIVRRIAAAPISQQRSLLSAASEIGIFTLPKTFCHDLESYADEIRKFGLTQASKLVRQRCDDFDIERVEKALSAATYRLQQGKLSGDVKLALVKLMTDILDVSNPLLLSSNLRHRILWGVSKALDQLAPNASTELRDLLRAIRKGVMRKSV